MKRGISIILMLVAGAALFSGCDGAGGSHGSSTGSATIDGIWGTGIWYGNTSGLRAGARPLPGSIEGEYRYSVLSDIAFEGAVDDGVPPSASGSLLVLQDSEQPSWLRLVFEPDAGTQFPVELLEGVAWEQIDADTGVAFTACELDGIDFESGTTVSARLIFYRDELYGEIEITDADGSHHVAVLAGELSVLPLNSSLELIVATLP